MIIKIDKSGYLWYKYQVAVFQTYAIGDWSNGMIGVSKTFGGSSILSSPANKNQNYLEMVILVFRFISDKLHIGNEAYQLLYSA